MTTDIWKHFQDKTIAFKTDEEEKAENLFNRQKNFWQEFLTYVVMSRQGNRSSLPKINHAINIIKGHIETSGGLFRLDKSALGISLIGKVPILRSPISQSEVDQNLGLFYVAIAVEVVAPMLDDLISAGAETSSFTLFSHPSLMQDTFIYLTSKTGFFDEKDRAFDALYTSAQSKLDSSHTAVEALLKNLQEQRLEIAYGLTTERTNFEEYKVAAKDDFNQFLEDGNKKITAAREAAFEGAVLSSALQVWDAKLRSHRVGFWVGLASLVIPILLSVSISLVYHKYIFEWLPKKGDGDIPYGFIVLSLVPIVAFGWLLKVVGRLTTNAGALGDDARQRKALISTYLNLVGDPNSRVEQGERLLILSAIFRPLVNQGQDDLSGPTAAELLKDALTPKK